MLHIQTKLARRKLESIEWDLCSVGSLVVDSLYLVDAFPEVGGEANASAFLETYGGASGNVAIYSSFTFGCSTVVLASVGRDQQGNKLREQLEAHGVDTS